MKGRSANAIDPKVEVEFSSRFTAAIHASAVCWYKAQMYACIRCVVVWYVVSHTGVGVGLIPLFFVFKILASSSPCWLLVSYNKLFIFYNCASSPVFYFLSRKGS